MDPSVAETFLDAFGPFLFPVVLFTAGAVGYGVLLLANRLRTPEGANEWTTETPVAGDDATEADRHEG